MFYIFVKYNQQLCKENKKSWIKQNYLKFNKKIINKKFKTERKIYQHRYYLKLFNFLLL